MKNYNAILVGNGTMGRRHRARFEECGVRFNRILDVDAAEWIASDETRVFEAGEVPDFAVVASPASTHYKYAKFFLERHIPVLVEKPLATTAAEAQELVDLSRRNNTLLFVAQSECYNPIFLNFRKHLLVDLKSAVAASKAAAKSASAADELVDGTASNVADGTASGFLPLNARLEFRREHGFNERCRDVDVALDLLIHDVSLFLNLFDAKDVMIVDDGRGSSSCGCNDSDCGCGGHDGDGCCGAETGRGSNQDRIRMSLKVVAGEFAGVDADFVADRNSCRDLRTIAVEFGRNGNMPGFDYSVSLVRYTSEGSVAHIPDSLDNEHRFFLKLLAGACGDWADRALLNAAHAVMFATGVAPE